MLNSDWSSAVCSSDLIADFDGHRRGPRPRQLRDLPRPAVMPGEPARRDKTKRPHRRGDADLAIAGDEGGFAEQRHITEAGVGRRSEESRVGKAWVRTCSSRGKAAI